MIAMLERLRGGTFTVRVSAVLMLSLVSCLVAVGANPVLAAARPAKHTCSTAGLHYSEERAGVKYSDAVVDLQAKAVSCADARSIASQVAQDILRGSKVPKHIDGLKVTLQKSCGGCAPDTGVSARSGKRSVTFTVQGGA
jgi:hypothetical protein